MHRPALALAALLLWATASFGADYPVAGDALQIRGGVPAKRRLKLRSRDAALDPSLLASSPTTAGATLEIYGAAPGDGDTGSLPLAADKWTALGSPPGAKGYRYRDKAAAGGIRKAIFAAGKLVIGGKGASFPYGLTQPQVGPIHVRLSIGDDVVCARFSDLDRNDHVMLSSRREAAPPDCSEPPCGNGIVEAGEECDDDNLTAGDGCTGTCLLEDESAICAGLPSTAGTGLASELVAEGLDRPVQVVAAPLDPSRIFVLEQGGRIRILRDGAMLAEPFLDLSAIIEAACFTERGLFSLTFHPDYDVNGYFFVCYSDLERDTVVARYRVTDDEDVADAGSGQVVLEVDIEPLPIGNHRGGQIAFGPDGYLYVGLGDGGDVGDPFEYAQDDQRLNGKILRLNVDALPYTVPASNPFAAPGGPLGEIWAKGVRQPWRFSFDRAMGDLYLADVGQDYYEEINYQSATSTGGENYGWDVFEGDGHCFEGDAECATPAPFTMPVHEYGRDAGCSITGGFVYRGCAMPDLHGRYFYSDYCSAFVRSLQVVGGVAQGHLDHTAGVAPSGGHTIDLVTSLGEDARGELYITDQGGCPDPTGEVYKLVAAP